MGEDILKKLRSQEAVEELKAKFARPKSEPMEATSPHEDPLGTRRLLQELVERNAAKISRLENIPWESESFPPDLLNAIFALEAELYSLAERMFLHTGVKQDKVDLQNATQVQFAENCLLQMEQVLDSADLWQHKFTTMPGSGGLDAVQTGPHDSVYYVTKQGLSFRLRKMSLYESGDLKEVNQGIMEKIWYEENGMKDPSKSEEPILGWRVKDLSSSGLLDLERNYIQGGKPVAAAHSSPLRLHRQDGTLIGVSLDPAVARDEIRAHTGDRINKIYF